MPDATGSFPVAILDPSHNYIVEPLPEDKKEQREVKPLEISLEDLQRKKKIKVSIRGQDVLVVWNKGQVHALDAKCSRTPPFCLRGRRV